MYHKGHKGHEGKRQTDFQCSSVIRRVLRGNAREVNSDPPQRIQSDTEEKQHKNHRFYFVSFVVNAFSF